MLTVSHCFCLRVDIKSGEHQHVMNGSIINVMNVHVRTEFQDSMRSSVSAILSTPTQDPNMSHPDYEMTVYDHGTLLILVKHLGK